MPPRRDQNALRRQQAFPAGRQRDADGVRVHDRRPPLKQVDAGRGEEAVVDGVEALDFGGLWLVGERGDGVLEEKKKTDQNSTRFSFHLFRHQLLPVKRGLRRAPPKAARVAKLFGKGGAVKGVSV